MSRSWFKVCGDVIMKKYVLAMLAGVGIMIVLVLYYLDVLITNQSDLSVHSYHNTENRDRAEQPSWLDKLRRDGVTYKLADVDLSMMTTDQIFLTLHSYLDNIDIICRRKLRMGRIADGGWEVCDDIDVRPIPPCIVYSYGINDDWSFDDDISKFYGCHVHSFDPSVTVDTHNRSSHVHFYKLGIAGQRTLTEDNWKLYSHQEIRSLLKHENTAIDVIKMDVENAEWKSLESMLATDQFQGLKQLFVEFHISRRNYLEKLKTLKLLEIAGFKRFYVHKNKNCKIKYSLFPIWRTFCYEVHYIKR